MSLINHKELKRQLASGEFTSLDDITAEFKNIVTIQHPTPKLEQKLLTQ